MPIDARNPRRACVAREDVHAYDSDQPGGPRTVGRCIRGNPLCERLRVARVRPIQNVHLLQLRRLRGNRRARPLRSGWAGGREGGRGDGEEAGLVLAWKGVDVEVVGLDGERLLELELVRGVDHDEVEALQDGDERDLHLLPGEGTTLVRRTIRP